MIEFAQEILTIANVIISLFVLVVAIVFLSKTKNEKDRKPWVFLLMAVIVFFILQIVNVLGLLNVVNLTTYRYLFDLLFLAIILFTFIFQYNLILNSELIKISKKCKK